MKFRFRLQTVLDHRERLKKQAEEAYLLALSDLNKEKQRLEGYYEQIRLTRVSQATSTQRGGVTGGELAHQSEFIAGVAVKIERQKDVVREHQAIVEEKLQEYQVRAKDHEVLVKLREKKWQLFRLENKKREQKHMDELATMRRRKGVAS